jgi:1-phosphofructokinase
MSDRPIEVVTVTPNPAIDWTLTIPGFAAGAVNRVESQRRNAGGKGVNVAAALAAYGHHVAATGFLGDANAALFAELFGRMGIDDRFVRVPGETRVGIKILDPRAGETTDVNFPGLAPAPADVEALRRSLPKLAGDARPVVVLAGSVPPGVEPTIYRDLARDLASTGCRVVLDTSGEPLRHALDSAPHVVKPNVHELEALVGHTLSGVNAVVEAARGLLARGVGLAVVSMGAEGAVFARADRAVVAVPPRVTVGSTVGAGDAMVAGIVAALLADLDLPDMARLASAFSLATLTRAEPGPASRSEIDAAAGRIDVRKVTRADL